MFRERIDRELAEQIWLEEWEEIQNDDHLLRLWEAAQARDEQLQEELETLIEQGLVEIPF